MHFSCYLSFFDESLPSMIVIWSESGIGAEVNKDRPKIEKVINRAQHTCENQIRYTLHCYQEIVQAVQLRIFGDHCQTIGIKEDNHEIQWALK